MFPASFWNSLESILSRIDRRQCSHHRRDYVSFTAQNWFSEGLSYNVGDCFVMFNRGALLVSRYVTQNGRSEPISSCLSGKVPNYMCEHYPRRLPPKAAGNAWPRTEYSKNAQGLANPQILVGILNRTSPSRSDIGTNQQLSRPATAIATVPRPQVWCDIQWHALFIHSWFIVWH